MSLLEFLHPSFRVTVGDATLGRDDFARHARSLAIPRGVPGRVVVVPARDPVETLAYFEAAHRASAVPMPSARCERAELASELEHAPSPDLALVLRTSGSTGSPRFPGFTLDAVAASASRIAADLALTSDDRIGLLPPCDHGFGLVGQLLAGASVGAHVFAAGRAFPVERARALVHARATVFAGVPFALAQLAPALDEALAADEGLGASVRQIGLAGGAMTRSLAARYRVLFPRARLVHQYGCTEAGPRLTSVGSESPQFASGSVGRPIAGARVFTLDTDERGVGELVFTTETAMARYVGDAAADAAARVATSDGVFLRTGDLGRVDSRGFVFVDGRVDDVVKVRGEKVALDRVARIAEDAGASAAFAMSIPQRDAEPILAVLYEGTTELGVPAFVGMLPPGVLPKRLVRVPKLPRLPGGKIDRAAARRMLPLDRVSTAGAAP